MHRYLSVDIICSKMRTDNVQGQIYEHISRQMEVIVSLILQVFFNALEIWLRTAYVFGVGCTYTFIVLCYDFVNNKDIFPLLSNNHTTSHLLLNLKRRVLRIGRNV